MAEDGRSFSQRAGAGNSTRGNLIRMRGGLVGGGPRFWRGAAASVLGLGLCACTAEVSRYHHGPTEDLYDSYELTAAKLAPCTHAGVVISPKIIGGYARVRLGFLAAEAKTVHVTAVRIAGAGPRAAEGYDLVVDETLVLGPMPKHPGFFQAGFSASQPGVVPDEINALGEHGFVVAVTWTVNGSEAQTELTLTRTVTRQILWPT